MFGNLLTNRMIEQHIKNDGKIKIIPFEKDRLQVCQYKLSAGRVLYRYADTDDSVVNQGKHDLDDGEYEFRPHEYVRIEVKENVMLGASIVGRFIPASALIDNGFVLTAGKIDPKYGEGGEKIYFGLLNALNMHNRISKATDLAYVEFYDVSGASIDPYDLTNEEQERWSSRRVTE